MLPNLITTRRAGADFRMPILRRDCQYHRVNFIERLIQAPDREAAVFPDYVYYVTCADAKLFCDLTRNRNA